MTKAVEIRKSPDGGLYRYYVMQWWDACEEDKGVLGDDYWSHQQMSGYFSNEEECRNDAVRCNSWLQDAR